MASRRLLPIHRPQLPTQTRGELGTFFFEVRFSSVMLGTSLIHLLNLFNLKEGAVFSFRAISDRAPFRARFRPDRVGRLRAREEP